MSRLNAEVLKGCRLKVTWSTKDPLGVSDKSANLFIKNLDPNIEQHQLHDVFEKYGSIRSCKVGF